MGARATATPTRFQRFLLPGLAFKGVVIGGGYATGRELAEFFLPAGPWGGVCGMLLAMLLWSAVCMATFAFARAADAYDYCSFFKALLGPAWVLFEAAYLLLLIIILAVIGAAAGVVGEVLLGWPKIAGTLCLVVAIAWVVGFGSAAVERLFKVVSGLLYLMYLIFLVLAFTHFGDRIAASFSSVQVGEGWIIGGLEYAGYNVIAAVLILPLARHMTRRRDALVAGALAGPLAMLPALLFFICMAAYYPEIGNEALPSDFLLQRMQQPLFQALFQLMIFGALLETGVGALHAINERVAGRWRARRGIDLPVSMRVAIAGLLLLGAIFLAERIGLIGLIAKGYGVLAWAILAIYVLPLLTLGLWRLHRGQVRPAASIPATDTRLP